MVGNEGLKAVASEPKRTDGITLHLGSPGSEWFLLHYNWDGPFTTLPETHVGGEAGSKCGPLCDLGFCRSEPLPRHLSEQQVLQIGEGWIPNGPACFCTREHVCKGTQTRVG